MNAILVNWYRALRRYHTAKNAYKIAKRISALVTHSPAEILTMGVSIADLEYVLRTAVP